MAETIGEIVAWLRNPKIKNPMRKTWCDVLASRIEEAWKRERAEVEADALEVGGIVEAARTAEKSSAVGNAAAMHEALVQCELFLGNVSRHGHPTLNPGDKCTACNGADELRGMVVRALAAPARNCDRFSSADEAIGAYRQGHKNMVVNVFLDWLFAPAAERKGEGK